MEQSDFHLSSDQNRGYVDDIGKYGYASTRSFIIVEWTLQILVILLLKIQATWLHDWWLRLHIFSGLDEAKKKIDIPQEDRPASWLRFHLGWGMVVLIAERRAWIDTLQIFGVEELKNIK